MSEQTRVIGTPIRKDVPFIPSTPMRPAPKSIPAPSTPKYPR